MTPDNNNHIRRAAPSFLPATAVLEMTYKCNHQCLFCSCPWYADGNGFDVREELSVGQWKNLIAQLCTMGVSSIAFTGGEPLMKDGIEEIISFSATCKTEHIETEDGRLTSRFAPPKLYLLTNGKNMNDSALSLCKKFDIHLSLSLPGLETFAYHTGGGDPQKVLHWFTQAKQANVGTTVGVTVTQKNIHELYETIAQAFIAGADDLLMNRFLPGGRGLKYKNDLSLTKEQIPQLLDTAEAVLTKANRQGHLGTELPKCVFDASKYKRLKVASRCSAGKDFFVIDPSGYTRVCNHSPIRLTHIEQINELKQHPYWKRFVQKDYLPGTCRKCDQILQCDGGCREAAHVLFGDVTATDPVLD